MFLALFVLFIPCFIPRATIVKDIPSHPSLRKHSIREKLTENDIRRFWVIAVSPASYIPYNIRGRIPAVVLHGSLDQKVELLRAYQPSLPTPHRQSCRRLRIKNPHETCIVIGFKPRVRQVLDSFVVAEIRVGNLLASKGDGKELGDHDVTETSRMIGLIHFLSVWDIAGDVYFYRNWLDVGVRFGDLLTVLF